MMKTTFANDVYRMINAELFSDENIELFGVENGIDSRDNLFRWRGMEAFSKFLYRYATKHHRPSKYGHPYHRIDRLILKAYSAMMTGNSQEKREYLIAYDNEGEQLEKLVNARNIKNSTIQALLSIQSGVDRALTIANFGHLVEVIALNSSDNNIRSDASFWRQECLAYWQAQDHIMVQEFTEFMDKVYGRGLGKLFKHTNGGMSGQFGFVTLLASCSAGRIMITFQAGNPDIEFTDTGWYHSDDYEQVSFVVAEENPSSYGIQSCYQDYIRSAEMIREVIRYWPRYRKQQELVFKQSDILSFA